MKKADKNDLNKIKALLQSHGLPVNDISKSVRFYILEKNDRFAAVGGYEKYGKNGLLRSIAVEKDFLKKGFGREIVAKLIDDAKSNGIENLFLLTESAESFFLKFGFKKADRNTAPTEIKESSEFKYVCPQSAVFMHLTI